MKPHCLFAICYLLFLTGCASKVWYQPGFSQAQSRMDLARCKMLAAQQGFIGVGMVGMIAAGASGNNYVNHCMEAKGYQWVKISTATNYGISLGNTP